MTVPTLITDLSQTAASNAPSGTSDSPAVLDDVQRAHASFIAMLRDGKGHTNSVTLASGATTDIGGQNSLSVEISGTTTITSFGSTYNGPRFLRFTGALILTHNATTVNLPGAANITTAAGDTCIAIPNLAANGWNVVAYQKASAAPGTATTATTATYGSGIVATTAMTFQQTSAPTGWTKVVTHNDKALRVVSGTASSGGSVAFTTAFSSQNVGNTTLTEAQIPSHTHSIANGSDTAGSIDGGALMGGTTGTSGATGGGGSHTHTLNIAVSYVDLILATKD